jgi:transcriptional regulator with XRE-family HTH domain
MMQGSLAEELRVLRARMGLSLTEAAARAGVTRDTLSDLEHGKRHPYMPTLAKIAAGYGVPVEDLLEEPVLLGKGKASETGQPEEVVRDLAEVAQEVLPLIDELYEQERSHRAQLDASEGIPQTYFVRAESKIVDLFSDLHRDAAPQVLAMVGLYYRRKVAQLEEENSRVKKEAEREGLRR